MCLYLDALAFLIGWPAAGVEDGSACPVQPLAHSWVRYRRRPRSGVIKTRLDALRGMRCPAPIGQCRNEGDYQRKGQAPSLIM